MPRKKIVEPIKQKQYICHLNDHLRYEIEAIRELNFTDATISEIPKLQEQLIEITDRAFSLLDDMKERGIAMENRLNKYRNAITELGYERKKP